MAYQREDPRGPGMPGSGGWTKEGPDANAITIADNTPDAIFDFDAVSPLTGRYTLGDSVLQINLLSNATVNLSLIYRILTRNNGVVLGQRILVNAGGRTSQLFSEQVTEGFVLSAAVVPVSPLSIGQYLYASIGLRRLNQSLQSVMDILAQGYASTSAPLSFPASGVQRCTDGGGVLRVITGATPAAGADISETVPGGARWQLLSLRAQLTTAVAVANRQVALTLDDGANVFYETADGPAQIASLAWEYIFAPTGFAPVNTLTDVDIHYDNAQLQAVAFRIRTDTTVLQAADQWTAPTFIVREWQDPG